MKTQKIPKAQRLTRAQVAEGLQSVPVEVVLLGAAGAKTTKLTAKQRKFAEGIAMGKTKAGAYREAYSSTAKPHHQSLEGQRLAANPAIARQIDALRLAAEARKYATPAALRALVIERLTAHALDEDINPAQRLRALELLGKVTEVAAFTERREIIKTTDAGAARAALLDSLRQALRASAIDAEIIAPKASKGNGVTLAGPDAAQDAAEVLPGDPGRADEPAQADPTAPAPPARAQRAAPHLLSNPHVESTQNSDDSVATQTCQSAPVTAQNLSTTVTPVTLPVAQKRGTWVTPVTLTSDGNTGENPDSDGEGGGAMKSGEWIEDSYREDPPGGNWVEK